jgi:hypothetical protein
VDSEVVEMVAAPDDAIAARLLAVAQYLRGLYPHEIEQRIFSGLTTPPGADLPARRATLFRAGIGLAAPLPKTQASNLAAAVARALRPPPDADFSRRFVLAHARRRLAQVAHDCAESMRRDDVEVTPDNLALALMTLITQSRRGCELILNNQLVGCSIETRITIAVADYFGSGE